MEHFDKTNSCIYFNTAAVRIVKVLHGETKKEKKRRKKKKKIIIEFLVKQKIVKQFDA